jgi:AraC-like DNA-binding protein
MRYLTHTPAPPLAEYVDFLWSLSDAPVHARERILPSGTLELVVNLHEDEFRIYDPATERCSRFPGAMVSGAYRGPFVIDTREHAAILGVHFKPGGAFPFLGLPSGEMADRHVSLEVLWGRRAVELREHLCEAAPASRFALLERALLARLSRDFRRHGAVQVALDRLGMTGETVAEIAARVDLSHRRFIAVVTAEIGMTPKVFERVRRFQRALECARRTVAPDWARLSVASGYCDQSHLIRDFVAFSGFSPAQLLSHRDDPVKQDHVVLQEGQVHPIRPCRSGPRSVVSSRASADGSSVSNP